MTATTITVGLPTYTGERFLAASLDSLLAQDHPRFELLISDNGSTDRTGEIARAYALRDPRIRYLRSETNRGAVWNFDRVRDLATGDYFMWASDHDLWSPGCLTRLAAVLDAQPEVVLAYGRTLYMDIDGRTLEEPSDRIDTRGLGPARRLGKFLHQVGWCNLFYGLYRTEAIRSVAPSRNLWSPDIFSLAALTLRGAFTQVDEVLFHRRENRPPESQDQARRRVLGMLDPATAAARGQHELEALNRELRDAILGEVEGAGLGRLERLLAAGAVIANYRLRFGVPLGWRSVWRLAKLSA